MKANELRIGNFVLTSNDFIVKSYSPEGLYNLLKDIEKIKPIPLTEEWLLKFGFEKKLRYAGITVFYIKSFELKYSHGSDIFIYDKTLIKYVHSLQNLYFALTGEELTIKTTKQWKN